MRYRQALDHHPLNRNQCQDRALSRDLGQCGDWSSGGNSSPCYFSRCTPFSVSLCAASVPLNRTSFALPHASAGGREILDLSLHSLTQGAGGRETLLFSFLFRFVHKFVHNVLLLVLVHQLVAQDVRLDLCLVSFKTHRIQDGSVPGLTIKISSP